MSIKFIQFGLGPIGIEVAKTAISKGFEIIGAVDIKEDIVGKDVADVLGLPEKTGIEVKSTIKEIGKTDAAVVFHNTVSKFPDALPQVVEIIELGYNVVSTTEEMSFPLARYPEQTKELDEKAKSFGVTVLGTGVNPGFVLDTLPIVMTTPAKRVERIVGLRVQNASVRRFPFQKKIGSGMTPEEFVKAWNEGKLGHMGFKESTSMIAYALGWKLDRIEEICEPVIAGEYVETQYFKVEKGLVRGLNQRVMGFKDGEEVIKLQIIAALEAENPRDEIFVYGDPNIHLFIEGGLHGDIATVSVTANMAPIVISADPGFKTMIDLPVPRNYQVG